MKAAPEWETCNPSSRLKPEAQRALEEAEERRREQQNRPPVQPEHGGGKGPEPTRYGDWEKGGIASDF